MSEMSEEDTFVKLAREILSEEKSESSVDLKVQQFEEILAELQGRYEIWLIKKITGTRVLAVVNTTEDERPSLYLAISSQHEMEIGSYFDIDEPVSSRCLLTGVTLEPTKMMMDSIGLLSGNLQKVDQIMTLLRLKARYQSYSLSHSAWMELRKYYKCVEKGLSETMKVLTASLSNPNPHSDMSFVLHTMFSLVCIILAACVSSPGTALSQIYSLKMSSHASYKKFCPPRYNVTFPVDFVLDDISSLLEDDTTVSLQAAHEPIAKLDEKFPMEVAGVFGLLLHDDVAGVIKGTRGEHWLAEVEAKIPLLEAGMKDLKESRDQINPHSRLPPPLYHVYDYVVFNLRYDRSRDIEMKKFVYKFLSEHNIQCEPNEEL